jgi:hypothetical protein
MPVFSALFGALLFGAGPEEFFVSDAGDGNSAIGTGNTSIAASSSVTANGGGPKI